MSLSLVLICLLAYIIINFIIAYVWNQIAFKSVYEGMTEEIIRPEPIIPLGFVSILIHAGLMITMFALFYSGGLPEAIGLSLLVGMFGVSYSSFVVPAKFRIQPLGKYAAFELVFGVLHYGVTGVALGLILS